MRAVHQIKYNRSNRGGTPIKYIVVHDTGNPSRGANATAHYNYFNGGDRSSSADFFVDDTQVLCVNDYYKYYTWHCGDGHGKHGITNRNSVGIEFCINVDSDRDKTLERTAQLVRELMQELNIPIERVVRHYDASRKNCPQSMSKNGWAQWYKFKEKLKGEDLTMAQYEELKNEISQLTETVKVLATELSNLKHPMIYNYIDKNMPEWARSAVSWAVENGILNGDENGLNLDDKDLRFITMMYRMRKQ
ncbi:MAG: N-acetylmuramoyl-L-alanine amidase [Eubacteriales bacterium]|nr:N-acetylmuramoyl-L-alanine amidase [Eubacteriales bacterium]